MSTSTNNNNNNNNNGNDSDKTSCKKSSRKPKPSTRNTSNFKSKYLKSTYTTSLQSQTEQECAPFFISIPDLPRAHLNDLIRTSLIDPETKNVLLLRSKHKSYLQNPLRPKNEYKLPGSYISLDSSKPWIIYWTLHSLDLLDDLPSEEILIGVVHTLESCWTDVVVDHQNEVSDSGSGSDCNETGAGSGLGSGGTPNGSKGGGFGGGVNQMPHCATTYAAVNALSIIAGCDEDKYPQAKHLAMSLLQRKRLKLLKWYLSLRYETTTTATSTSKVVCGFRMHHDGEVDVRATYCVCAVASLLNILTEDLKLGMMEHVVSCQTYEGGFGGEPFSEAHGGYTFCALGALHIVSKDCGFASLSECGVDTIALEEWLVMRQMGYEGGFNGRSNKLADGCYTFWVGSAIAILDLDRVPPYNGNDVREKRFDAGVYSVVPDDLHVQRLYPDEEKLHSALVVDNHDNEDDDDDDDGENNDDYDDQDKDGSLTFDQQLLQRYVLLCAQDVNGGLRDKPSKSRDFYHSCYNLSGLSVSQHVLSNCDNGDDGVNDDINAVLYQQEEKNIIGATHPVYNIRIERVRSMIRNFHNPTN